MRATRAGQPVVLREHAGWDRNCAAIAHPALYLAEPPRHGSVCMHVADIRIRALAAGTEGQCIGQSVRGVQLLYRTEVGYAGGDTLRYAVQYPAMRRTVTIRIAVAPDAPAQPSSVVLPPPAQQVGPVPPCAELMF